MKILLTTSPHVVNPLLDFADRNNGSSRSSETERCRSQDSTDSGQESAAASDAAVAGATSSEGLHYPNPKNFAERLMNVLERGIAPDCIWWVDEGIRGVAIQPKKLKKGTLLQTHFSGNKYSAFLRSFNRWGFRRVSFHNVPDGAVVYKNCLFRMDKPHLVKHMRMDSDVQDVFERHQLSSDSTSRGSSPSVAAASMPGTGTVQQQGPAALEAETPVAAPINGSNDIAEMLQQLLATMLNSQGQQPQPSQAQQQQQPLQQQEPSQFLENDRMNSVLQNLQGKPAAKTASAFLEPQGNSEAIPMPSQSGFTDGQLLASAQPAQQRAPRASDFRPPQVVTSSQNNEGSSASNPLNGDILASALELLVRQMQQEERKQPPEPLRNTLLRQILEATGRYMEQTAPPSLQSSAIRATLELLQIIGKEELGPDSGKGH
jgi:HSF-type DNA-binding